LETVEDRCPHPARYFASIEFPYFLSTLYGYPSNGVPTGRPKPPKFAQFQPTDGLSDQITWKRLKVDGNILQVVLQALNFLSSHAAITAMTAMASPRVRRTVENAQFQHLFVVKDRIARNG